MQNWKLTLTYDGTGYHGWQIQPNGLRTVQGEIQSALHRILGESPLPQGSGRTDTGVHALAQVASFELASPIPARNLHRALNRTLPPSIRILDATPVSAEFHARHSAQAKTYEYRIFQGSVCSPFLAPYVHHCTWNVNPELLQQSASAVIGEHDFLSLAASDPDRAERQPYLSQTDSVLPLEQNGDDTPHSPPVKSTIRTIFSSEWVETPLTSQSGLGSLLVYRVRGNGFLHHMVRNLVGTMLEIARGQFPPNSILPILQARSRSAAGPTAPASGLFLYSVEYSPDLILKNSAK